MDSRIALVAVLLLAVAVAGCAPSGDSPSGAALTGCTSDGACAMGSECIGSSCVDSRPTLYGHIQLASALLRSMNDNSEVDWSAANADLFIGGDRVDDLRAINPNLRTYQYITNRYNIYENAGADWAAARGLDSEDFFVHYREDVFHQAYASLVLVPGFAPGIVPGWNPNPQPGDPPASATARNQARAIGIPVGGPMFIANVANANYRAFLIDYALSAIAGTIYGGSQILPNDGVMVDNAIYYPWFNEGAIDKTEEFAGVALDDNHPYAIAHEVFYYDLMDAAAVRFSHGANVLVNYGHVYWLDQPDRFSQSIQNIVHWTWGELWMTYRGGSAPTSGGGRVIQYDKDYDQGIVQMILQTRRGGRRVLGARDLVSAGAGSDRGRLLTLALYYLVHNPNTYYLFETVNNHRDVGHVSSWQSNPLVVYDVGQPAPVPAGSVDFEGRAQTIEHYEFASGTDPYNPSLTYHVLARNFSKALILVKMLPSGSVVDSRSQTTHQLGQGYSALRADGTPGPIVTEVTLKNNEGVILIKP